MNHNCQARGCGARAVKSSECWCTRHRKILNTAARALVEETEIAQRGSREWNTAVQKAQEKILEVDKDAGRQTEMAFSSRESGA